MMIFFSSSYLIVFFPLHTMEYILGFEGSYDLLTQLIQEMKKEELLGDYTEDHVTYEPAALCSSLSL